MGKYLLGSVEDFLQLGEEHYKGNVSKDWSVFRYGDTDRLSVLDQNRITDHTGDYCIKRASYVGKDLEHTDTSAFQSMTADELESLISQEKEVIDGLYKKLLHDADTIQLRVVYTMLLMRIRESMQIRPIQHSNNVWVEDYRDDCSVYMKRSNAVYSMWYRIYEDAHWNSETRTNEKTGKCKLYWDFGVWNPVKEMSHYVQTTTITEQVRSFKSKEAMEKYLTGRIKAYDKYFAEAFPPVPAEYVKNFMYGGVLLPGYRQEEKADV